MDLTTEPSGNRGKKVLGSIDEIPVLPHRSKRASLGGNRRNFAIGLMVFFFYFFFNMPKNAPAENIMLGGAIALFAAFPFWLWVRNEQWKENIPFFEMLFLSYAFSYGFAVLQPEHIFRGIHSIPDKAVTGALLIILAGMGSLFAGWRLAGPLRMRLPFTYHMDEHRLIRLMIIYCAMYLFLAMSQRFAVGESIRGFAGNLGDYVFGSTGLAAIFGLSRFEVKGKLTLRQRYYYWGMVGLIFLVKISSGWLMQVLSPVLALFFGRLVGGRFSRKLAVFMLVTFLFFQVGKSAYRNAAWEETMGGKTIDSVSAIPDQVSLWINASSEEWQSSSRQGETGQAVMSAFERLSHLDWFAWVVYQTPEVIPFLNGYSYDDFYLYLVPRFLWPEKPINLEKANTIAVRYGWIYESQVGQTSVSPGLMDEVYINFGRTGIFLGMTALGAFFRLISGALNNPRWGKGWQLLIVVLLCEKWMPLSTAVSYFGGFVQPLIIILMMYLPARVSLSRSRKSVAHAI